MSRYRTSLLLSGAAITLGLVAPAAAQNWVPPKPFARNTPYVGGDMHNHTTCSDGSVSTSYLLDRTLGSGTNNGVPNFNIDWFTHGNHGGSGNRDCRFSDTSANLPGNTTTYWTDTLGQTIQGITIPSLLGDVPNPPPARASMYRWQSIRDVEYPIIIAKSQQYKKVALEGLETIVPGHEHSDTAVLNGQFPTSGAGNASGMAEFEFRFDRADADTRGPVDGTGSAVWTGKSFANSGTAGHGKAVQSVQWLQANAPLTSYYVPTHTERAGAFNPAGSAGYNIEHFRDFNNAGPTVAFGLESPGHAADASHSYGTGALGGSTFGGSGIYTAKIGGLWDGMLGEGRNFFIFQSSDWHNRGVFGSRDRASTADFFPGEYSHLYVPNQSALRAQSIVDGMRSGNSYSTSGDVIGNDFTFRASVNGTCISGSVTSTPTRPTPIVIGKPMAKMFICCATREITPSTRLVNSSMATSGRAIHRPSEKISAPQRCGAVARRKANGSGPTGNGVKLCTNTSPSISPRPARPLTWVRSWKVRSPARKSGTCKPRSALRMPTSVTLGKCRPLAIIWVPMRMSILCALKADRVSRSAFFRRMASASMRANFALGKTLAITSSTFWVP